MAEPEKPFACNLPDCGMTFTNEDRLHVHMKKHDMLLQFGMEQKSAFVADQTPTPTRFIRNCEEVGLFQDLQHVNPFDEGFKRAVETKQGVLSLEGALLSSDDALHTPQMVFPLDPGDSAQFTTTNNHRNITISRSSSDESGAVKEYETTTISKLTNEVTRISRVVDKTGEEMKNTDSNKDIVNETSVSFTNNVIKIQSNVEIRKDDKRHDTKDGLPKDGLLTERIEKHPIMSQRSIEFVVDSLADYCDKSEKIDDDNDDEKYEVKIKLPNGKELKMKAFDDDKSNAKDKLKAALAEKADRKIKNEIVNLRQGFIPVCALPGTLIPVKLIEPAKLGKVGIPANKPTVKRKLDTPVESKEVKIDSKVNYSKLECRSAASRRYRQRLKSTLQNQTDELKQLRLDNQRLTNELTNLKVLLTQHLKRCPIADELRKSDRINLKDEYPPY